MVGLDRIGWAGAQKMTGCLAAASRTVCRADRAAICLFSHRQPRRATEACATQLWKSPRGLDRIDLCQITAEQVFIDQNPFSRTAGEVRHDLARGVLCGGLDGDRVADWQVFLIGTPALGATDVLL